MKTTKAQNKVLEKMTVGHWYSAYVLQCSIATLNALAKKKIVERSGGAVGCMFCPRTSTQFKLKETF